MNESALELIKSLSYAFYGICLIVAGLMGALIKLAWNLKTAAKLEKEKELEALKVEMEKESIIKLRFQGIDDKIKVIVEEQKKTNDWIDEVVKDLKKMMTDGFAEVKETIKNMSK